MKRADFARSLGAAAATVAFSASASANAQTPTTVRVLALEIDDCAEAFYAAELGYFKDAGLRADVTSLSNGSAITAAIVSDHADVGISNTVTLSQAFQRGIPVALVAPAGAYISTDPTEAMVVSKKSTLLKPTDLAGKTVAVAILKSQGYIALRCWLAANRIDPESIRIIEMPYSEMDAGLEAGRIDAALIVEPFYSECLASHGRLFATCYDAMSKRFCTAAWFCRKEYADLHPEIVRAFARVIERTAAWANKNHTASAQIFRKDTGKDIPPYVHRCYYPDRLLVADFQPIIDAAARYGVLKASFPVATLFAAPVGGTA